MKGLEVTDTNVHSTHFQYQKRNLFTIFGIEIGIGTN